MEGQLLIHSLLGLSSVPQTQHISAGVHRPAGADLPAQHPRHQAALPPLRHRTVVQHGQRGRGPREQHPPHPLHHPHRALRPQHVRGVVASVSLTPPSARSPAQLTRPFPTLLLLTGRGPPLGRRKTCRVSRSSRQRSGWRARTRWRGHTTTLCWPCTSCRRSAGGPRGYTSCGGCSSARTHARSQQAAPTSRTLTLTF